MSAVAKQPYGVVRPVADRIVELLRPYCHRIEVAGSLRREAAMVGDIEICAIPRRFVDLLGQEVEERPTELDRFLDIHEVTFMKRGARYQRFKYGRFEVDLFLPNGATWGSIFTIRTGGWEFSRWLVLSRAAGRGEAAGDRIHRWAGLCQRPAAGYAGGAGRVRRAGAEVYRPTRPGGRAAAAPGVGGAGVAL